jgi:hypothetical protein
MIPQDGQYVKCILKNGAVVEGYVEEWIQNEVQLRSIDGESIMIITHPEEDIMLIKIMLDKQESIETPVNSPPPARTDLEQEFEETYNQPSNDDLRVKKLAELKIMLVEQDKKIITDKMKDHRIGEVKKVMYGYPGPDKK